MSDEYILDDVVETFSDEDTLMSDIRNNPVKWLLSMAASALVRHTLYQEKHPTKQPWRIGVCLPGLNGFLLFLSRVNFSSHHFHATISRAQET